MKFTKLLFVATVAFASGVFTLSFAMPSVAQNAGAGEQSSRASSVYELNDYVVTLPRDYQASKLRDKAIQKATREGFVSVLKRLTPRYIWRRHEQLVADANWNTIASKLSVKKEVSNNEDGLYQLTLNITYNRDAIRDLLVKNNIPYSEDIGGRILMIPVLDTGSKVTLWGADNPWAQALKSAAQSQRTFDFILPVGDIEEVSTLSPQLALAGASDALLALGRNYDTDVVVVVSASVLDNSFSKRISVKSQWYEAGKTTLPITITAPIDDSQTIEQVLPQAATDALSMISEHKRSEALVDVSNENKILLRYRPQSAADLEAMRNKVRSLNTVKALKLRVMNVQDSVFQVTFYGDRYKLQRQLEEAGLEITETNMQSVWQVRLKDNTAIMGDF